MGIDLMECMRGGVTDLRFAAGSPKGDADERGAGPHCTGVYTVLGAFHVDRYVAALMSVAKELDKPARESTLVPTKFVLAQPWSVERICREVSGRRTEQDPEPIKVDRLRVPTLPDMYSVISGCHRTFAARGAGEHAIAAEIHDVYDCDPTEFCIQGLTLKREIGGTFLPVSPLDPWGTPVAAAAAAIPVDLTYILQALGIRMFAPDELPHVEAAVVQAARRD